MARSFHLKRGLIPWVVLHTQRCEIALLIALLCVAAGVRLPGLISRSIGYDEAITLYQTAGHFSPAWPTEPTPVYTAKQQFEGTPSIRTISEGLRRGDIHPPIYFWSLSLWRRWWGFSLGTARAFSVLCSLGTILVLYGLLRVGNLEYPLVPTLVYSLSTGAVYYGYEARAYAFASLLITTGALCAYLAYEVASRNARHAAAYSMAMAVCCGVAFHTNYLTLFPIGVIVIWFLVNLWPVSRSMAIVSPLVAVFIEMLGCSTLLMQLGARPDQNVGFVGMIAEIKALVKASLGVIWIPRFDPRLISTSPNLALIYSGVMMVYGGLVVLMGTTLALVFRHWSEVNRKLWILLIGLVCAPAMGVFLLDLLFDKYTHRTRYLLFAGPALAIMMTYSISKLMSSKQRWGMLLLVLFLAVQIVGVDWGFTTPRSRIENKYGNLAKTIKSSSSPSHIVVIVGSWGLPGALVYELDELDPQTMIVVVDAGSDFERIQSRIQEYEDVWITFRGHAMTHIWNALSDSLQKSGRYTEVSRSLEMIHLQRTKKTVVPAHRG